MSSHFDHVLSVLYISVALIQNNLYDINNEVM